MTLRFTRLIFLSFFLVFSIKINAQIIFVKPNAGGDGTSWSKATSLINALAKAKAGQTIWVSQGIYTPTTCTVCTPNDRKVSFIIPDSVRVFGGFAGSETSLYQRNISKNQTILSGDIDSDGKPDKNSMRLVYTLNVSSVTTLDGFTLSDANANDTTVVAGEYFSSGAAFFNDARFSVSSPAIANCTFLNNYAAGFGGAIYNDAAYYGRSTAQITRCTFKNNRAHSVGGAVHNNANNGGFNTAHFEFCNFENNVSDEGGGAVFNDGDNGVNQTYFANCKFINNNSTSYGGAMYNLGKNGESSPAILNCLFSKNTSYAAGAIYNLGSDKGKSNPQIVNCTFYKNSAHTSGAIYANAGDVNGTCVPTIVNSLFWKNTAEVGKIFRNIYGTPKISYCIVDTADCNGLNSGLGTGVVCGSGMCFDQDPIFEDAENNNFHLKPGSTAINTGNTAIVNALNLKYDLDSAARIYNNIVDMGCYEFAPAQFFVPEIVNKLQGNSVCEKVQTQLAFKASGTPPLTFNWFRNNKLVTTTTNDTLVFASVRLQDTGFYYVVVTNARNQSIQTDSVYLSVAPLLPVSISIAAVKTPICINDSITIAAKIMNGGTKPRLNWQLNSAGLGLPDSAFTITTPVGSNFFKYACILTSSERCTEQNPIISNVLGVNYNDSVAMTALMTQTIITTDKSKPITFKIDGTNLGDAPTVKWFNNGKSIAKATGLSYTTDSLKQKEIISAVVTSSISCARPAQIALTAQAVTFTSEKDLFLNDASEVIVYPNPVISNELTVSFSSPQKITYITVSDATGKTILFLKNDNRINVTETTFALSNLISGVFTLQVQTENKLYVRKFIKLNP